MTLDPVLLEIFATKVAAAAEEISLALKRSSRSIYVKEAADFGTGLVDLKGKVFGYPAAASVPFFLDADCRPTIDAVPDLADGDVIITNDPYLSEGLATHVPDLHMIQPYFHKGRVVAYGWCFIHFMDLGGRVPSSISPSNHEIFQEGMRVPPMKVMKRGRINRDFIEFLRANTRTPDQNLADVTAMLGALATGGRRVDDMIERHGIDAFLAAQSELQDYTGAKACEVLRRVPDGTYAFWDYLDDDFVSRIPVRVRVEVTINDGRLHFDLTGTDPQVAAAYNVVTQGRCHEWLTMRLTSFLLTHDPTMAANAGLYRPITCTNPPGTILNAQFPDAVGIRHTTARRLNDAMTGALLKAAPDMMAAPTCGASAPFVLAEYGPDGEGRNVTVLEPMRGGMGALKGKDGVDGRDATLSNMQNHPLETVEREASVIIREYDIRGDSGGAGQWRGGTGQMMTVEFLRDGGIVLARGMERLRFPPWGVAGAKPAAAFRCLLNRGRRDERVVTKIDELHVNAGDTLTILMPGASGIGDPYLRPPETVRADVEQGFVSRQGAASDYGVVIADDGAVDEAATGTLRSQNRRGNPRADFDFGREREAWEEVFDDETMLALNRRLAELPKSVRYETRRRIFEAAVPNLPMAGTGSLAEAINNPNAARARLAEALLQTAL
jgi:N-methylhydantoinase B